MFRSNVESYELGIQKWPDHENMPGAEALFVLEMRRIGMRMLAKFQKCLKIASRKHYGSKDTNLPGFCNCIENFVSLKPRKDRSGDPGSE
ncbi:hypothetical protein CRP01_33525 [Flavilitoribacter nigricans DSM 23189 = NBRC 102662]|uniref:Uncharacterized protein n=1 Tax=Flavilitoribacter nigricans (strain ATCC 23147 / DSM 23189 / NBRC 102662 / NCIMB 1420 / SS-2) TaxID=1122177 RepID=A0A2D0N0N2_FLAN2|nr:hypothetical protein CRP01_33525 [Flavilitoribacter nigricans DSM 23189 = NBRC 102662]